MNQVKKLRSHIGSRPRDAAQAIDGNGEPNQGSCKEAEYNATPYSIPGYYPHETCYLLGVDLPDDKYLHSMTVAVQYELAQHGLMFNSFYIGQFSGYRADMKPIEHDWIFHVVDLTWLPEKWI